MNTYEIIDGKIVISSTPTNIQLYKTSKRIIEEYSLGIDTVIKANEVQNSVIKEVKEFNVPEKHSFINLYSDLLLFNRLYCFFLNFSIDFSICTRELSLSTSIVEQVFFIKAIYIELYRYLERHNMHLGIIKKLAGKNEDYIEYNKLLNNFKLEHYDKIKNNRNLFFAHFDKKSEYEDYYGIILKFNIEEEAKMCISFLEVQQKLSKIYSNLFNQFVLDSFNELEFLKKRDGETKANLDELRKNIFYK